MSVLRLYGAVWIVLVHGCVGGSRDYICIMREHDKDFIEIVTIYLSTCRRYRVYNLISASDHDQMQSNTFRMFRHVSTLDTDVIVELQLNRVYLASRINFLPYGMIWHRA